MAEFASRGVGNAALTTGIIGTAAAAQSTPLCLPLWQQTTAPWEAVIAMVDAVRTSLSTATSWRRSGFRLYNDFRVPRRNPAA